MRISTLCLTAGLVAMALASVRTAADRHSVEYATVAKGDTMFPRYYCKTDSILDCSGNGRIVVRRCGLSRVYMRLASKGAFITGDSIAVNACSLMYCDSLWSILRVRGDTSIVPIPCLTRP